MSCKKTEKQDGCLDWMTVAIQGQYRMDRTETELQQDLKKRLRFETLLAEISARYVNLPVDRIDSRIENDQRLLCECLDLDLSSLWQWSDQTPRFLTLTHLYTRPGGPARPEEIDAKEAFPWVLQKMLRGETLAYNTEDMPHEAAVDQESRRHFGVISSVNLPLSVGGGPLIGVLTFDTLREERVWSAEIVKRLTLVAQVFSNALARMESDRTLRDNEARLSLAAASAAAGLWELNFSSGLFWATERALAIFGYDPGDVVSMERFEQSVYPDDREHVRQVINRAVGRREPFKIEYRILTGDKRMKWIYSSGHPYFKPNGKPDRLLGVSIDITERKALESQRIINEERLASAIDIAALGFYEMVDHHIRFLDDRMRNLLGILPGDEKNARQFWLEHIHAEDLPYVQGVIKNVLEEGVDRFALDYRYRHPERGLTWLHHLSRVLERDADGRATRVIGVMRDITDRKQKDTALRESMEHYRAMVEAFDGLIYICSQDYRVEYMNSRMIERTGRNGVNELCYRALHDRNSICPWCVNERVFRGEVVRWEVQSPKDQRWYYVVNTPIQHIDGSVSKQAMIMDITERKLAEETLRASTAILRNNQKDLQRLAGRLISGKEEELRRLSRELHDDLTQSLAVLAIEAGKLELQMSKMEQPLSDPIRKISMIKEHLIKFSEDVHRISRQLHPTILDDLGLVRAIESECAAFQQRGDIKIIFRPEGVPDRLPNDIPLCIYRIVQEGLKNIIHHSRAESCEVVLRGTGDSLFLAVRDNGEGFDPAAVRNLPGLGLASMRERVQLVQGHFSIDTRPGRGTTIHVTIPLEKEEA